MKLKPWVFQMSFEELKTAVQSCLEDIASRVVAKNGSAFSITSETLVSFTPSIPQRILIHQAIMSLREVHVNGTTYVLHRVTSSNCKRRYHFVRTDKLPELKRIEELLASLE